MSLATYLLQIRKFNPLSHEEILTLIKKAKKGSINARNEIIKHNLRLVVYIAKRYHNKHLDLNDLIEEGNLGLFTAIRKFNPGRGIKFSTYAVYWIKQSITRCIDNTTKLIRIPVYLLDLKRKLLKNPKKKKKGDNKRLSLSQINITSLSTVIGEDSELLDFIGVTYPLAREIDAILAIETLNKLEPRNVSILKERLNGMTLKDIGIKYDLSRERVRQIEAESVMKIKRKLNLRIT